MPTWSEPLVPFLLDPSSYEDPTTQVHLVETHISWVFLTDHHVYKLKKPVRFDFLDFSTCELREAACREEFRLNRRLAPNVYLDVLPITRQRDNTLAIDGGGEVADWVVKMRRLDAELAMDLALTRDELTPCQAQAVADTLVSFHAALPAEAIDPGEYCEAFQRHIAENLSVMLEVHPDAAPQLRAIHSGQLIYLHTHHDELAARVTAGRVVDGHGDLRPEHIYLEDSPVVIDCIEFSPELRRVDVADEISFLAMECERLGNSEFGQRLQATYEQRTGDRLSRQLLSFYRSYRACVRAKVAMLRERQLAERGEAADEQLASHYLRLAKQHAESLGPPCVIVVGGMIGTGKSTLAARIASDLGAEHIATDQVRQELLGRSDTPAPYGEGHYRRADRDAIYCQVLARAEQHLANRQSVLLDGTYLASDQRRLAFELADKYQGASLWVLCECDRDTSVARIRKRQADGQSASEARIELYDRLLTELDPPTPGERVVRIDTTLDLTEQARTVYVALGEMLGQPSES